MADSEYNPDIETGADTLLDFLEEKSRYPVSDIAEDLGVPEEKVEKWAEALEKGDLITIDYSAIKGMVLEYDSDKSIDELNAGRHELSMKTDSVQVNVEEIEEMEDKSDSGASAGFVQEAEEEEEAESEESVEEKQEKDTGSVEKSDGEENSELPESETSEKTEREESESSEDSIESSESGTDSSGKPDSNNLSVSKKDSDEDSGPSVTMRAKKAMLNKIDKDEGESSESESESEGEVSEELDSNLSQIEKKGSGKYQSEEDIDWNPGEDIKEVDQNIRELSDLISDSEYDSEEVYDRIAYQTKVLKEKLKEKPLSERDNEAELRQDIVDTIDTLNTKINQKNSLKSKLSRQLDKLKSILSELVHKIGIEKVDE